jgi:hypothetical protein
MYFLIETHLNKMNYNLNFILLIGFFYFLNMEKDQLIENILSNFFFFKLKLT